MRKNLQSLINRWKQTGSNEDEQAMLSEMTRSGVLTEERLKTAAAFGHDISAKMLNIKPLLSDDILAMTDSVDFLFGVRDWLQAVVISDEMKKRFILCSLYLILRRAEEANDPIIASYNPRLLNQLCNCMTMNLLVSAYPRISNTSAKPPSLFSQYFEGVNNSMLTFGVGNFFTDVNIICASLFESFFSDDNPEIPAEGYILCRSVLSGHLGGEEDENQMNRFLRKQGEYLIPWLLHRGDPLLEECVSRIVNTPVQG